MPKNRHLAVNRKRENLKKNYHQRRRAINWLNQRGEKKKILPEGRKKEEERGGGKKAKSQKRHQQAQQPLGEKPERRK